MNVVTDFLLSLLIVCCRCDDVRLGADGRVSCPAMDSIGRVDLLLGGSVGLYANGQNFSTEKYILAEDFLTVTVTAVTVSDEGSYSCRVATTSGVTESQRTILYAYGKRLRYLQWRRQDFL